LHLLWHFGDAVRRGARHRCGDRTAGNTHHLAAGSTLPARRAVLGPLPDRSGVVELPDLLGAVVHPGAALLPLRRLAQRPHDTCGAGCLSPPALPRPSHELPISPRISWHMARTCLVVMPEKIPCQAVEVVSYFLVERTSPLARSRKVASALM